MAIYTDLFTQALIFSYSTYNLRVYGKNRNPGRQTPF